MKWNITVVLDAGQEQGPALLRPGHRHVERHRLPPGNHRIRLPRHRHHQDAQNHPRVRGEEVQEVQQWSDKVRHWSLWFLDSILFHFQVSPVHVQMLLMVPGEVYEIYQQKCIHSLCNEGDSHPNMIGNSFIHNVLLLRVQTSANLPWMPSTWSWGTWSGWLCWTVLWTSSCSSGSLS